MLDLSDIRAFARIADFRSVSGAARALNAPKSSVSRSLARLETALGVGLVERSTRHLRLTEAGELFQAHARRILNDLEEAETALGSFAGEPRGTLRVNATYAFAHGLVAPMLADFLARYPGVRVVLDVENRRIDVVADDVDLVIRMGALPDSDLICRRLTAFEIWHCASPAYIDARGRPATLADLADHDLVARSDRMTNWQATAADGTIEEVEINARAIVSDVSAAYAAVLRGAGIGRIPDYIAASAIAKGDLLRVLEHYRPEVVEAHALYPSHRSLSAKVRVFIDALIVHIAEMRSAVRNE